MAAEEEADQSTALDLVEQLYFAPEDNEPCVYQTWRDYLSRHEQGLTWLEQAVAKVSQVSPKQLQVGSLLTYFLHYICKKFTNDADTPLMMVISKGFHSIAMLLIEYGINIESKNSLARNALMTAAIYNNVSFTCLLLSFGADPNQQDSFSETALSLAVKQGNPALVGLLLMAGANIYYKQDAAVDMLSFTVIFELKEMHELLLQAIDGG